MNPEFSYQPLGRDMQSVWHGGRQIGVLRLGPDWIIAYFGSHRKKFVRRSSLERFISRSQAQASGFSAGGK